MKNTVELSKTHCNSLLSAFDFSSAATRVLCRHGVPLVFFPKNKRTASAALDLYIPQSISARIFHFTLKVANRIGIICALLPTVTERLHANIPERSDGDRLPFTQDEINSGCVGVLLCNPDHGARLIAAVANASDFRVVKWGDGKSSIDEYNKMKSLREAGIPGIPELFDTGRYGLTSWFSMEYLHKAHVMGVADLSVVSLLESWMGDSIVSAWDFSSFRSVWAHDSPEASALRRIKTRRAFVHGDFAPWNLRAGKNGLIAIDFELADLNGIAGYDLCYGLLRVAILVKKMSQDEAVAHVERMLLQHDFDRLLYGWRGNERLLVASVMNVIKNGVACG